MRAQTSGYDVFALANSLDPGVVAVREVFDIPVVVQMEVSTSVACMTGEKFGVVATNEKAIPRYREIVRTWLLKR
jgi:allantoin racemase